MMQLIHLKLKNLNIRIHKKGVLKMINSLFMLGGSYNKDRKISILFLTAWILYMLINYDFSLGLAFPLINAIVLLTVTISINLISNKKVNTIMSIFSILIWSIIIDIVCFYMFPMMSAGQSLINYILQGILFNYKYIFVNIVAICGINLIILLKKNIIKRFSKNKNICENI